MERAASSSLLSRFAPVLVLLAACAPSPGGGAAPSSPSGGNASAAAGGAKSSAGAPSSVAPREVRTARVAREAWPLSVAATGELAAFEESALSVKVPGRLARLAVDLGVRVDAGALVAEVDARDYELRVKQAEAAVAAARTALGLAAAGDDDAVDVEATSGVKLAKTQLDAAKRDHARAVALVKDKVGTQADLDDAETALRLAETRLVAAREDVQVRVATLAARRADLALAKQQLADTRVVAPYAGEVTARLAGTVDYLAAGAPVARLVRLDPLRLRVRIPERDAVDVHAGQEVRFTVDGARGGGSAPIARVAPGLGAASRALVVECDVPAIASTADAAGVTPPTWLRPGAFVRAEVVVDANARALVVPPAAVASFAGIDKLLVVKDGKVLERRVKLGRRDDARVEVLDGVGEGDEVVLAPGNLAEGAAVRVTK